MCVQSCRTFLWGGTGYPVERFSPDATCSCTCDSDTWVDHNILGESSCVPTKAHVVFGWVGLTLAMLGLTHAIYQLQRQVSLFNSPLLQTLQHAHDLVHAGSGELGISVISYIFLHLSILFTCMSLLPIPGLWSVACSGCWLATQAAQQ